MFVYYHRVLHACVETDTRSASLMEIPISEIQVDEKPFAHGGFADVYKAKWRKKDVAVKVIKVFNEMEEHDVKHQAKLTLHLNHQNVVKVFGIIHVKKRKFGIVMELAEHGSLDMCIGKIGHEETKKIALGIIDGLEYVHSQHVMHRDIKPQNIIMFGPKDDMIPKIAGFGVSKVPESGTKTRTMVGSMIYMAPEVKMNIQYNFIADIFSLAMTLFEMFNEQLISDASEEVKMFILYIQSGRISKIPESCKVPVYLRDVIERGWSEEPEKRPTLSEYRSVLRGKIYFFLCELIFRLVKSNQIY